MLRTTTLEGSVIHLFPSIIIWKLTEVLSGYNKKSLSYTRNAWSNGTLFSWEDYLDRRCKIEINLWIALWPFCSYSVIFSWNQNFFHDMTKTCIFLSSLIWEKSQYHILTNSLTYLIKHIIAIYFIYSYFGHYILPLELSKK